MDTQPVVSLDGIVLLLILGWLGLLFLLKAAADLGLNLKDHDPDPARNRKQRFEDG